MGHTPTGPVHGRGMCTEKRRGAACCAPTSSVLPQHLPSGCFRYGRRRDPPPLLPWFPPPPPPPLPPPLAGGRATAWTPVAWQRPMESAPLNEKTKEQS